MPILLPPNAPDERITKIVDGADYIGIVKVLKSEWESGIFGGKSHITKFRILVPYKGSMKAGDTFSIRYNPDKDNSSCDGPYNAKEGEILEQMFHKKGFRIVPAGVHPSVMLRIREKFFGKNMPSPGLEEEETTCTAAGGILKIDRSRVICGDRTKAKEEE